MAFKKGDIQKRMEASAISVRRQSLQGLLAMGVIGANPGSGADVWKYLFEF